MLDEKDKVEYIHVQNGEKITPLYRYKAATELLSYLPNSSLGFFEYTKDENNLASHSTPKLAISPVATQLNNKLFHLFITDNALRSIEVWNTCCFYDNNCLFDFHGKLELKGITGFGGLAIENSGKDLLKVSGDVTFYNLYVACPNESKIKYIEIPMSFEEKGKSKVNLTLNIEHKALTKPMDVAVKTNSNSFGHTLVAVFNGKCGRIFLFCKTDKNSFNLLNIYARSILNPPSHSRVFFDPSNNLWVSSYKDAPLLIPVAGNNENENEEWQRDVYMETDFILSCDPKENLTRKISFSNNPPLMEPMLGPLQVNRPFFASASVYANIIAVAGRSRINNSPMISLFKLQ